MIQVIEGQVSIFDLPVITPKEEVKKVIEIDKNTDNEIINKYKSIALRIIKCFGGRYSIETEKERIMLYRNGKEDYRTNEVRALLPMDNILFAKEDFKVNDKQEQLLEEFEKTRNIDKVIKRFGDYSYIVITKDSSCGINIHVINNKGWIIDYKDNPIYKDEEVIFKNDKEELQHDKEKNQNNIKTIEVGSVVKVKYQNKEYIGKVVRVYGPGNKTVNVIFNGMHSAFYMDHVESVSEENG